MSIATVTTESNNPPVNLLEERERVLDALVRRSEDIVSEHGVAHYNRLLRDTIEYYNSMSIPSSLKGSSADDPNMTTQSSTEDDFSAVGSSLYFDESRALMRKISNADLGVTTEVEIRPPLRRLPNEMPAILRMVDSRMEPQGIIMSSGWAVTALKLSPNFDSLVINSAKIINRYQTMTRWVEEHWGDEIDIINLSGSTFSFFGFNINRRIPGLVAENRSLTQAYKSLRELSKLFTVNGMIIQDNRVYEGSLGSLRVDGFVSAAVEKFLMDEDNKRFVDNHPREGLMKERLYVNLLFDYLSCYGYLDTFDISESSTSPYRMTYTIVFKSEKTIYRQGLPSQGW